ncbi:zinc finger MYND domain-containing protein 12 isoform X2 [Sander lucioperca]|uniref:zinc finger MYND domain-containing protein 12 isoform X2 n=2 Tax=Sander lucioperca TaxID=283035 RepID=UPI0016535706|nr:zinc finger MYND domain-containing protein 12 isoform X2 [Sander lucioperca]
MVRTLGGSVRHIVSQQHKRENHVGMKSVHVTVVRRSGGGRGTAGNEITQNVMKSTSRRTGWGSMRESVSCLLPFVPRHSIVSSGLAALKRNLKRLVGQSKLSEGKHQEALPAAQFCLRCSIDLHGPSTVQMVPAYLLLAEANMGLGNLARVAELLSQAEWAVLKSPECGHAVRHRLHRSLGRLHTATGNLEAALLNFADDIYFASEEYSLDSTVTCGGYFLMADVFTKQGKMPIARSLYSQVAHTWHCHLTKLLKTHVQNGQNPNMLLESSYDKAQLVEVDEMLKTMLEFEQNDSRKDSTQVALVAHCLAMLWFLGGDSLKALGFGSTALQASQLIPNHDLTEPIQGLLQLVQNLQTESHPGSD